MKASRSSAAEAAHAHQRVCLSPPVGIWTDRCGCGHLRVKHQALSHPAVTIPGGTCTGRNDAGRCVLCDCVEFALEEK